jgi:hypothetical protein
VVLSVDDVVPLHLADVTFPDWHPLDGGTGAVLAFALRHPTGLLLFETGIGTGNQFIDAGVRVRQAGVTSLARYAELVAGGSRWSGPLRQAAPISPRRASPPGRGRCHRAR